MEIIASLPAIITTFLVWRVHLFHTVDEVASLFDMVDYDQ